MREREKVIETERQRQRVIETDRIRVGRTKRERNSAKHKTTHARTERETDRE